MAQSAVKCVMKPARGIQNYLPKLQFFIYFLFYNFYYINKPPEVPINKKNPTFIDLFITKMLRNRYLSKKVPTLYLQS